MRQAATLDKTGRADYTGANLHKANNRNGQEMSQITEELCRAAVQLPPAERLDLVQRIMETLDASDEVINTLWAKEADDRFDAYKRGEIQAHDESEVFGDLA